MTNYFCLIADTTNLKNVVCKCDTLINLNNSSAIVMNEKILGLSPENAKILIPVIVTLSIFIMGIIINTVIKKYERKSYLSSIKSLLITWCKLLDKPVKQQSKSCRDFNMRLHESKEMQPERFSFNNMLANKILSIQLKDLIDTIVLNHRGQDNAKSKCLFNIIGQIEFIDKIEKELRTKYETYHQDSLKYMDDWNEAISKLDSITSMLRVKYYSNPSHPVYSFYLEVARVSNLFIQNNPDGPNIQGYKDQLLTPISKFCKNFIRQNSDEQDVYALALAIQDLLNAIRKWDVNRSGTGELFMGIADSLDSSMGTLLTNIQTLEEIKFKWLIYLK